VENNAIEGSAYCEACEEQIAEENVGEMSALD
jgi:hypothetical protein